MDVQKGNYEDLYFLAEQIAYDACSQVDNPAIHPFVSELKEQTRDLTDKLRESLGKMAALACDFIRCVVHHKLSRVQGIEGLHLIESLARSSEIERLDIATLNHDLLGELFLKRQGIPFVDGFGAPNGDVRYFEPSLFESAAKVRLFKLHGSINWHRFRDNSGNPFSDRFGIALGGDPEHARDAAGNLLSNIDVIPWILAGTHSKAVRYGFGIYAEMHFWFHRLLKEHTTVAMSGYGWGDRGINGRMMEWLHADGDRRLFLMHKRLDDLVSYSKSSLRHSYTPLVNDGRIIPIRKWMQHVSFDELRKRLAPALP